MGAGGEPLRGIAVFLACLAAVPAGAAETTACYWDAPGLPYAAAPPEGTPAPDPAVTPLDVTFGFAASFPDLPLKAACGVATADDIVVARRKYRHMGCTPESPLGRMIEGLAEGGPFLSEISPFLDWAMATHPDRMAPICRAVTGVEYLCLRTLPEARGPLYADAAAAFPHCAGFYDTAVDLRPAFLGLVADYLAVQRARHRAFRDYLSQAGPG